MKISTANYSKSKQAVLPLFISDYLDICDPVLVFDRFMEEINLEKYLKNVPQHTNQHAENSLIRIYDQWIYFTS